MRGSYAKPFLVKPRLKEAWRLHVIFYFQREIKGAWRTRSVSRSGEGSNVFVTATPPITTYQHRHGSPPTKSIGRGGMAPVVQWYGMCAAAIKNHNVLGSTPNAIPT